MANLIRNNSLCPNPEEDLLKYVCENKVAEIENLLRTHRYLTSHQYGHPFNKPILYIACKDRARQVSSGTVDVLIKCGADPHFFDKRWGGWEALHFAALGQNPDILKTVIQYCDDVNVPTSNGLTALLLLIKEGKHSEGGFEECVDLLIRNGVDVRRGDNRNAPPVYWAAKKKLASVISMLLKCNVDLDTYSSQGKTARTLIEELGLSTAEIPVRTGDRDDLLSLLKEGDEDKFVEVAAKGFEEDKDAASTFLQQACERNLYKIAEYLVKHGADPNRVTSKKPDTPLRIAVEKGYHKIVELLLEQPATIVGSDVLPELLKRLDCETSGERDHERCYELLMSGRKMDVNYKDKLGNYPLHYGARYGGPKVALDLLERKASLSNRNRDGVLTIADVDYLTLREHFDNCVEAQPDNKLDKENMTITFDYGTLLPSRNTTTIVDEEKKLRLVDGASERLVPETDAVLYMSRSSELRPLLKHPLVTSFLYVKWYRIRWIFYVNLLFYLTFCLSLLLYTVAYYGERTERSGFSYFLLALTSLLLVLRELFQIVADLRKYLNNFENYIELALIATVLFMLLNSSPDDKTRKQACAVVFLLAAFELLFLLGNYPELSTNIVMLRTVSLNFFKFLLFYSILILAFAFCFHTLFQAPHGNTTTIQNSDDAEEKQQFFVNPFISVFKTVVMLTGEFEAGEIEFDQYPITSHLIFLAFVVTIAVILLNLLNGLAVSDTQEIRNEAELVGHVARAQYVAHAESMIFKLKLRRHIFSCLNRRRYVYKPLIRKILLHPTYLTDDKLVIYPNQKGRIHFEEEPSKCGNVCLDGKIVRKARQLVQAKKEEDKVRLERLRLEKVQVEVLRKLDEVRELLRNSNS